MMTTTTHPRAARASRTCSASIVIAALALLILWILAPAAFAAEAIELSEDDAVCMECHDRDAKADISKKFEDGTTLSMRVSTKLYLESVHKENNCTDCHADLDEDTHGKVKTPMKNRRALKQSMQEACRDCHKKMFKEFDDSIHAFRIKEGSDKAPLCADCHNAHTQTPVEVAGPIDQTPCAACHEPIFKAYAKDVHGMQRVAQGKAAPICSDCHQAHAVKAASLGDGPKDACLSCHEKALEQHKEWLPNTGLHLESISCVACHAPDAQRRVNLRLYDGATKSQLREKSGVPQFVRRAQAGDAGNLGLDERALWSLLTQFSQDDETATGKVVVRGRLEVSSGIEAHQLSEKSRALKDCKVCHGRGAEPFQSVSLSIAGPDGRPLRHDVQSEVLSSAKTLNSVRGFYAIGSTRIKLLDVLLVLAVAGSIAGVLAHMVGKRMFRGVRERLAAEAKAAAEAQAAAPAADATDRDSSST